MKKKKFSCKECYRQFVKNNERRRIADAEWHVIDRLLLGKFPGSAANKMTCGYGLRWKGEQVLLSDVMSERKMMPELQLCGILFLKTAERTEYFSRTACPLAEKYFQQTDAELSSKEAGKQVISRGLI